jgi:hypothetical protein
LKLTWIRRILTQNSDSIETLLAFNIKHTIILGAQFSQIKSTEIQNPFWKDVFESWQIFVQKHEIKNIEEILTSPLWFNQNCSNKSLFFKNWYNKNIFYIIDLFDDNGNLIEFEQLKTMYGIQGTYLDYLRLWSNIPNIWKHTLRNSSTEIKLYKRNVLLSPPLRNILKDKKGCKSIFNTMQSNSITTPYKWNHLFNDITANEYALFCKTTAKIEEIKLKNFQIKINNYILTTKKFLLKINKEDSDLCSFCGQTSETIIHLLYQCQTVNNFISEIKNWLRNDCLTNYDFDVKNYIFSHGKDDTIRYIFLIIKYFIYKTKFKDNCRGLLTLRLFKQYLKQKLIAKQYISKINRKNEIFDKNFKTIFSKLTE